METLSEPDALRRARSGNLALHREESTVLLPPYPRALDRPIAAFPADRRAVTLPDGASETLCETPEGLKREPTEED